MRTTILGSVVTGFIALSLAACSGANVEPVDQSAQTGTAHLDGPAPAGSVADASGRPEGKHHRGGRRGPHDPAEMIKHFDKNADGKLELSELPEKMQKFMRKADANADGVITVEELEAGKEKMRAEHLAKVDTDHDGKVSPEEHKAAFEKFARERFAKMDKNNDGALTKDEIGDKRWERLSVADADKSGSVTEQEIKTAVAAGTLKFPHHGRGHGHGPHGEGGPAPDGDAASPAAAPSGT
jgi:Ca2+-binding EF-hand superfamily protein